MMHRFVPVFVLFCVLGLSACGNNDENNSNNPNNTNNTKKDMSTTDMTSGDMKKDDMAKSDMAQGDMTTTDMSDKDMATNDMSETDMGSDMSGTDMAGDMAQGGTATLVGKVTLSTMLTPGDMNKDGKGTLLIAVFNESPLTQTFMQNPNAMLVGSAIITDVDLSAGGSVDYKIEGLMPRAEAYYVSALLDDNGNVDVNDLSTAVPDTSDSIALDNFAIPSVELKTATEVTKDLNLSFRRPF